MAYPATLELETPREVANWRPLVHWLLAIPHLLLAGALGYVGQAVAVISWFAIVFTGALPAGLANVQCMIIRYTARTYSYAGWLREPYPPFEFEMSGTDPGTDPLRVHIDPALSDRNRLTVGLRIIWVIPAALFATVIGIALSVCMLIAFFAVLFTGRWPEGLRDFVVRSARYLLRVNVYLDLLTDEYPPFELQ